MIAVTVVLRGEDEGTHDADALEHQWREWNPGVPLRVLYNEYASVVEPIVGFIDDTRAAHPDDQIVVLIPVIRPEKLRYRILHNQIDVVLSSALRDRSDIVVARVTVPLAPETPATAGARRRRRPASS